MRSILFALAGALLISGGATAADGPAASVVSLKLGDGRAAGTATITDAPHGVLLRLEVVGLPPGWHGLHFHEKADCTGPDFKSAGAHVHTMTLATHGLLNPGGNDSGDLPNLHVGADGSAVVELFSPLVSLKGAGGRPALLDADGSALVIHANPDDYMSQPIGGAGSRIGCGVIQ